MEYRCFLSLLVLCILGGSYGQSFYVAAPSTFRLNSDETVAVAIDGGNGALVNVYVQDHPAKAKTIAQTDVAVQAGQPEVFKIRLDAENFPPGFLSSPGSPKLVSLNVRFQNSHKELLIPISSQSGYLFIQTDKPIYTPKQRAFFRIIPLTEEALPSNQLFQLQIKNPQGMVVEEKLFNENNKKLDKAFGSHIYKFPSYPVLGEWSATVHYGNNLEQNSTVHFELQEYVLPTFTVELKTPDVILPSDETIQIDVEAKHVYGKEVNGMVTFRLGVKAEQRPEAVFFSVFSSLELDQGSYNLEVLTADLQRHKDIGWFPEIEGSHLVVEATVVDAATGNNEVAVDSKTTFSKTPFLISFKRCLEDFKPGLTSIFEADIRYVGGTPAEGISTKLKAVADNGKVLNIAVKTAISDSDGKVIFEIQPEIHHKTITLTLETDDPSYVGNQAKGTFVQKAYKSDNNAYIAIARSSPVKLKPGDLFGKEIHFEPAGIQNIYYLLVSRGKILQMNKLPPGAFKIQRVDFQITHDMVPSFRFIVFAHYRNELIVDSLKIEVERVCNPGAEVTVTTEFIEKEPGHNGQIIIRGTKDTTVGLLGVDQAVYALSKKDLLTKMKVFDRLASHDLGCGPGGGLNVNAVLGNAGVMIGTNLFTPSHTHSCVEKKRRKRSVASEKANTYSNYYQQCCALGIEHDKYDRSCEDRALLVEKHLQEEYQNCSQVFLACCLYGKEEGLSDLILTGKGFAFARKVGEHIDQVQFIDPEFTDEFEGQITVRRDFRETWIYEDIIIGPDNREVLGLSLPHSITTWVIQAVSVSPIHGICVAEPQHLVSFKKIFVHLNIPYSVVRNEQVEIQATIFNYGAEPIGAVVYMYGAKDLCSGTQAGAQSEKKRIAIGGNSAGTVTFPVIPLKVEDFPIKVVVLTPKGSDVIEKQLHVVPEGIPKEIDISIKLDPTNQQRRKKRHIETELYSDRIDPTQNLQVTAVKLSAPEGFVPGTTSCSISAIGDVLGPVIETSLNNPDGLLRMPGGCGEQNMMSLAPTLYTMQYLKVAGKLTADREKKGYEFIRRGYANQLSYRKQDGSYAAFQGRPTSTWLTAFVMKVFCQATNLVHIDENVLCSGVRWLINNQEPDGSFIEKHPMIHWDMMGGVKGNTPMTAYALIALEECKCDEGNLFLAKQRALSYLENHLGEVNKPLPLAIVAYAMALSDSKLKQVANDKLLALARYDENNNWMYWSSENSAQDVETTSYGLLTQLLFNDVGRSSSIVNWLNTKQLQSGSFKSTQDTVIALQALSESASREQVASINLVSNISSSNDRNFHKVLTFREDNALVLQDVKIDKVGGMLFINTAGHGMGSLSVKLRYNMIVPIEEICKFDISVDVTETKVVKEPRVRDWEDQINPRGKYMFDRFPDELIRGIKKDLDEEPVVPLAKRRKRGTIASPVAPKEIEIRKRTKRQNQEENKKVKFNIAICVKYLGNKDAEMSIVDVGIFSGCEPVIGDLKKLQNDPDHLIQRYETSSRGVVFYLEKVPVAEKYCFSFHVIREYIVGNMQSSVIKVYDYYNPDATCTKFYGPQNVSPLLRTICDGGICECAEGGCPPKKLFPEISDLTTAERREKLNDIFCENYDYVWKGRLNGKVKKEGGFLNISFFVEEVVKAGTEKAEEVEKETRTLLARDNCVTANLFTGAMYLILGKDGQAYKNNNDEIWYRYLLDQTSVVHLWTSSSKAKDRNLQRDFNFVTDNLKKNGCAL